MIYVVVNVYKVNNQDARTTLIVVVLLPYCKHKISTQNTLGIHTATWTLYVMLCAIWYHLYNLKIMKNIHG